MDRKFKRYLATASPVAQPSGVCYIPARERPPPGKDIINAAASRIHGKVRLPRTACQVIHLETDREDFALRKLLFYAVALPIVHMQHLGPIEENASPALI